MKQTTIRYDDQTAGMLSEIDSKAATAVQSIIEMFLFMRRATLKEIKGKFTTEEITALVDSLNGLLPTWQLMVNPSVLIAHMQDAEEMEGSIRRHNADPEKLIEKLKLLTSAQATIMQFEIINFWNDPSRDLEKFIKELL